VRNKIALCWLLQVAIPGGVVCYALGRTAIGRAPSLSLGLAAGGSLVWLLATLLIFLGARTKRPILLRASISGWVTAILFLLALAYVRFADFDMPMVVWRVRQALRGEPVEGKEIGLYTAHPRYGWWHLPETVGRHEYVDYDVRYTTDKESFRITRTPDKSIGEVLCLGCSFTFGHGVSDDEPYAAVLADHYWTSLKLHNGAVNGWGTGQSLLLLEDYLATHPAPVLVIYSWIAKHAERNGLRKTWLEFLAKYDRKNPTFAIEDDCLVLRGLSGPEDGLPESPMLNATEVDISARLLTRIGQLCRQRGSRFVLVLLPYDSKSESYNQQLDTLTDTVVARMDPDQVQCLDLRRCLPDLPRKQLYFAHDPHPQPLWHKLIAEAIARGIDLPSQSRTLSEP
jgi:hypothetical protein